MFSVKAHLSGTVRRGYVARKPTFPVMKFPNSETFLEKRLDMFYIKQKEVAEAEEIGQQMMKVLIKFLQINVATR